jgi:hypothetical protein
VTPRQRRRAVWALLAAGGLVTLAAEAFLAYLAFRR